MRGKENLLFRLAEAALDHPDDTVRNALYPVVGPGTLTELVREGRASESALRARTRTRLRASYSSYYYRKVISELLDALKFRSSTSAGPVRAGSRSTAAALDRPAGASPPWNSGDPA